MGGRVAYRPKKADAERVGALRLKLSQTREWQRAQAIMNEIVVAVGKYRGQIVVPRQCKACGFFGHTRANCEVAERRQAEREEMELCREIRGFARYADEVERAEAQRLRDQAEDRRKGKVTQGEMYEKLGIAWSEHPHGLGAFPTWYVEGRKDLTAQ